MSKSIIIQKNGVAQTLTVDKLRLPDAAGGTENWLPSDGKNLVNLEVKQNGTYRASDFSAYGIAEVKVKCTLNGGAATSKPTEKLLDALHHPAPAEGGRARTMSAHHLETPQDGGGTVQWVPEAEVALGTKSVNIDNRTYKASDDGKYGYSEFTVSGISITKDGDTITHTDGTGTKTYTIPDHIRVEHGPLKITYYDGEPIDFFDMLVKAYNEDGTVWTDETHPDGVIPFDELILPITVADIDSTEEIYELDGVIGVAATASGEALHQNRAYRCPAVPHVALGIQNATVIIAKYQGRAYGAGYTGLIGFVTDISGGSTAGVWGMAGFGDNFDYGIQYDYIKDYVPESLSDPMGMDTTQMHRLDGIQTIPVQWERPWVGDILEDSFEIFVKENHGYGGAEGGGGQTSGGGAGRDN